MLKADGWQAHHNGIVQAEVHERDHLVLRRLEERVPHIPAQPEQDPQARHAYRARVWKGLHCPVQYWDAKRGMAIGSAHA